MTSSVDICSFFFEPVHDPDAPPPVPTPPPSPSAPKKRGRKKRVSLGSDRHRCRICHNEYTQVKSTGYTNLLTHLRIKHPHWEEMFKAQKLDAFAVAVATSANAEATFRSPLNTSSATLTVKRPLGRKRGPVYDHFQDVPSSSGNKQKKMRCIYCQEDTPQLSGRLKVHLSEKCQKVPEEVKNKYAAGVALMSGRIGAVVAKTEAVVITDPSVATGTETPSKITSPMIIQQHSPALITPQVPVSQPKCDAVNLRVFEEKLTTALIATNVPWSLLDNGSFREAMEALHPATTNFPLTAARARGEVLDRLTLKYDRDCLETLSNSNAITLVINNIDAGENGVKKTMYLTFDEWRRAYVVAEGRNASTSPCVAEVLSMVSDLPIRPSTKLFLCTPTSGTYARARLELNPSTNASGKLFTFTGACMTQQTALLFHELLLCSMSLEEALDNAVLTADALNILPSLRERVLREVFPDGNVQEDSNAFVQMSVTSWFSLLMAVKQATRLERFLRLAISEEMEAEDDSNSSSSQIYRELSDIRSNDLLWNSLRHTSQLFLPMHFISALSRLQTTTSGQLLALWIWLLGIATRSPLLDGNADALVSSFILRLECYVEEHFIVCLVLDPRVHGAGLSVSGLRRARAITVRVAATLIPGFDENNFIRSYNDYMKQQGDFGESGVWNNANIFNPITFWGDYEGDPLHNQLAVVAKTVCAFVPHSCSFDELWTAHAQRTKTVPSDVSKQRVQCTKIRHGATRTRNAKDIVSKYLSLLEVNNELSVEEMFRANAASQEQVERGTDTRNQSVRSVLDSVQDGIEEDAAGSNAPSTSLDASWFDISSTGLEKIGNTMQNYLQATMQ